MWARMLTCTRLISMPEVFAISMTSLSTLSEVPLADYDVTGLSLPSALHVTHRFPVEGEYLFRVVLGGVRPAGSEPLEVGFSVVGSPDGAVPKSET